MKPSNQNYRNTPKPVIFWFLIGNLLLATLWVVAPAFADTASPLFLAEYEGKYSGMLIKSTRRLEQADGGFVLHSKIKNTFASISEESRFRINQGVMVPQNYHYKRKIFAFKADENLKFDWQKNIAEYRRKKKPEKNKDHALTPGVLDPALYQLQIQRDVFRGKKNIAVTFVKSTKTKTLYFNQTGEEALKIGAKNYRAIKLERDNKDDKKETRLWLIPELNYQVGKVEHVEENGDSYTILMTHYESSPLLLPMIYETAPK